MPQIWGWLSLSPDKQMRRNDCILCSSIDHHKHFFYILHRGRTNFGLSIILFISATLGIYKGARRVINFQAASGIKKIGVCLSCCWLLVDPSGKKDIFCRLFISSDYSAASTTCTFYKFGVSSSLTTISRSFEFTITNTGLSSWYRWVWGQLSLRPCLSIFNDVQCNLRLSRLFERRFWN